MTISKTQHGASLFAIVGTRGVNLVGTSFGIFRVYSHVGGRDDSLYVRLRCTLCGSIVAVKRDQLSQRSRVKHCRACPRPYATEVSS